MFFLYFLGDFFVHIQQCFICRPSDSTMSTDAGIESNPGSLQLVQWQSSALTTKLDIIRNEINPDLRMRSSLVAGENVYSFRYYYFFAELRILSWIKTVHSFRYYFRDELGILVWIKTVYSVRWCSTVLVRGCYQKNFFKANFDFKHESGALKISRIFRPISAPVRYRILVRRAILLFNPPHGFFLLPGHLGGFIERCSWIRSPMERFGLIMRPRSELALFF